MTMSDSALLGMKLVNDFSMYKKTENTFTFASTVVEEIEIEHRNMIVVENSNGGLLSLLDNLILTSSCSSYYDHHESSSSFG